MIDFLIFRPNKNTPEKIDSSKFYAMHDDSSDDITHPELWATGTYMYVGSAQDHPADRKKWYACVRTKGGFAIKIWAPVSENQVPKALLTYVLLADS